MKKEYLDKLIKIQYESMYGHVLFAGIELDLFSNLKEEIRSDELSEKLKLNKDNTKHILNALYSMGYIEKKNDKFKNSENTNKYLTKESPYYFGDSLKVFTKLNDISQIDIVEMVKNGPEKNPKIEENLSFTDIYNKMNDAQKGLREMEIKEIISHLEEYPHIKKILDLGCGAGLLGLSIVSSRDDIKGVLYDLPPMGDLIKENVKEKQLEDRVEIKLGDYTQDDIGSGYDLVLAIGTLGFAKKSINEVLKKIYDSLNENGVFIAFLDEIKEDFSKPKELIVAWLPYTLNGNDMYLIKGFIKKEALKVGFKNVEECEKLLAYGPLNISILRK